MIPYFKSLGESIESAWLKYSYDENLFPDLVSEAIRRDPPFGKVDPAHIIDWIFGPSQSFVQPSAHRLFGEPPVMLFQAPRFYIEALFWLSGTTDIHEHAFSGAFAVLAGSSVHSHWRFTPEQSINSRLKSGRLDRVSTEILQAGQVRVIKPGDVLIHQLFHLDLPSVTMVIRTYEERQHLPQFKYLLPGLAIDEEYSDPLRARRLLFLGGMLDGFLGDLRAYAWRLIESGDLETVYHVFSFLWRRKADRELLENLFLRSRQRYGEIMDIFWESFYEERRTRIVRSLRAKVADPGVRFFLALLMLMPDRDSILETIRLQFPDADPASLIESWLRLVSGKDKIGIEFDDVNQVVMRGLIGGLGEPGILGLLREKFCEESVEGQRELLLSHAKKLAGSDLFRPLFSQSPLRGDFLPSP